MYEIISINEQKRWQHAVENFGVGDIYYSHQYILSALQLDRGEAYLFSYVDDNGEGEVVYPFIKRQIAGNGVTYYDITTPFGYGGPLLKEKKDPAKLADNFIDCFSAFCKKEKIIAEFIRFHPLKENALPLKKHIQIFPAYETYTIKLEEFEPVSDVQNADFQNRKITVKKLGTVRHLFEFLILYYSTVRKREESDSYHFFANEYFEQLISNLGQNLHLFGAYQDNKLISSCYVLAKGDSIYHHIYGVAEDESLFATKSLLLKIAEWGKENSYSFFHLGGDYEGFEKTAAKIKQEIKNEEPDIFYVGKKIHDPVLYDELILMDETDFIKRYRNV